MGLGSNHGNVSSCGFLQASNRHFTVRESFTFRVFAEGENMKTNRFIISAVESDGEHEAEAFH
jgi:hypothetical protein